MVTYVQFAERLARGQLKNQSAVEDTNLGEICPDYAASILNLTNQGLVEISTRLPVVRKLVDLTFVDGQYLYPLVIGALATYLDHSETEPFLDDSFVKVLDIYAADGTRHQPNTGGHIITPVYDTLRFTAAIMDETTGIGPKVRVQYQAKYVTILEDGEINLPPNLITALQLWVAGRYFSDMGGKEHALVGDNYYAMFLRQVTEDEVRNTSGTSEVEADTRFYDSGFV